MKKTLYPIAGLALWLGAIASAEAQTGPGNPLTGIYNAFSGKKREPVPPPPGSGLPYAAEQTAVPKGKAAQKPAAAGTAQQQKQAAANAAQQKPAAAAQIVPAVRGKTAAAPAVVPQAGAAPAPQTAQGAPAPAQPKAKAKPSKKKSARKASKTRIAKAKSKSNPPETGRATANIPPPAEQPAPEAIVEAPVSVVDATSPLAPLVAYREAIYAGDFERAGSLLAKELGQPSDTGSIVRVNALMDINLGVSDIELLAQKAQSASPDAPADLPPPDGSVPVSARIMASHSTAAEAFGRGTVNALASYKEAARMGDAQSAAMALIGAMHGALDEVSVKQANALLNVETDPGFIMAQTAQ